METDTFTIENVKAFELGDSNKPEETQAETPKDSGNEEASAPESSSFADAFKRATGGEVASGEAEPEEKAEPEAAPDKAEADEKQSRSASDFKSLKQERDTAKRELEELKAKLGELENNDVNEVLQRTQKERDEYSRQLKLSAIERHPEFQKQYNSRIDTAIEQAKGLVGEAHAERVEKLLRMDESEYRSNALEDLFGELSSSKSAIMGAVLQQIGAARSERDLALRDAESTYSTLMANQSAEQQKHAEQSNELFNEVAKQASNLEVYQSRDGDDSWNDSVAQRVEHARTIFAGDNTPQSLAEASLWAAAGPKYRELLGESLEINRRLREQISGVTGSNPSVSGQAEQDSPAEKTFMEAYREMTQG